MNEYILAFIAGGFITAFIVYAEAAGWPLLSRIAALMPVFTWISYLFIGKLGGAQSVSRHALFVLLGTLIAWVPYMFIIYYFAPRIGVPKAIAFAIVVFIVLAATFIRLYRA